MRSLKKFIIAALIHGLALTLASSSVRAAEAQPAGQGVPGPRLEKKVVLQRLRNPWDIAFSPDGTMFFTEKCRGLSVRKSDGSVTRLFGTAGSALVAPDLACEGQSGMNGVAVDPAFNTNRRIYVYMGSSETSPRMNHVIRLVVSENYGSVSERTDIIKDIPFKDQDNAWGSAGSHSGGRLQFGPDGFLYVTTGDNHNGTYPQDQNRLAGKVLRVTTDGAAAPGNGMKRTADQRIFTYGHRNVQGLTFASDGRPIACEHGPNHADEITILTAGGNGGWDPKPQSGVVCEDNYCGYTSNRRDGRPTSMTDLERFPRAMKPLLAKESSDGMGPCVLLTGDQWGNWKGALAVGIMGAQRLEMVRLNRRGAVAGVDRAEVTPTRFRALTLAKDGSLYVATDSGEIWQLTPTP